MDNTLTRTTLVVNKEELNLFKDKLKKEDKSMSRWLREEMKKKIGVSDK